jgi:hypothetical protein
LRENLEEYYAKLRSRSEFVSKLKTFLVHME